MESRNRNGIYGRQVLYPTKDRKSLPLKKNFVNLKHTNQTVTYGKGVPHVKRFDENT